MLNLDTLCISLVTESSFTKEGMSINDRRHSNYLGNESIVAVNELSLLTTLREIYRPGGAVSQLSLGNQTVCPLLSQWMAFKQLKSVLASVVIWRPSKRTGLEQFGH